MGWGRVCAQSDERLREYKWHPCVYKRKSFCINSGPGLLTLFMVYEIDRRIKINGFLRHFSPISFFHGLKEQCK